MQHINFQHHTGELDPCNTALHDMCVGNGSTFATCSGTTTRFSHGRCKRGLDDQRVGSSLHVPHSSSVTRITLCPLPLSIAGEYELFQALPHAVGDWRDYSEYYRDDPGGQQGGHHRRRTPPGARISSRLSY